jgi:adenylate cyclase
VAADIAGFSRLIGEDEEGTLRALRAHRQELIDRSIEAHGGRIANTAGDSLLLEFPSVVDAIRCVLEVQRGMAKRNESVPPDRRIEFRSGINLGDVIAEGDDLLGDGVNVAARLQELSDPGGMIISNAAYEQIRDRLDIAFEDMGEVAVKNIARPVRAFRIEADRPATPAKRGWLQRSTDISHLALGYAVITIFALAIGAGVIIWQRPWQFTPDTEMVLPDKPSIAVLPFVNLSADPKQEYFADGITDDLITDLSKVSGLFVIARNSVFAYKGKFVRVQDVARELNVRYVFEGSVRRAAGRVRVNAKLIDAASGRNLWAERYDRNYTDVLTVEDEVVGQIVSALSIKLTKSERTQLSRLPTENLEAYDDYLRALQHYHAGDDEGLRNSLRASRAAITRDPKFGQAYALYARTAVDVWRFDFIRVMPGPLARKEATDAVGKALQLDPNMADAHYVRALLSMVDGEHL